MAGTPPVTVRASTGWRALAARLLYGRRARAALEEARRELSSSRLDEIVARGRANAVGAPSRTVGSRRLVLRAFDCAVRDVLTREAEPRPCLLRSLALYREARRLGVDAALRVGVRRDAVPGVEGHAWVVVGGRPFLEDEEALAAFAVVAELPTAGGR